MTRRADLLASPWFAISVGVLLLNDHVLKAVWPGLVTGKLSDVAGVVMVAILLIVVLRRIGPALIVTAVAFAALKTLPPVAVWAAPVLGGVTRTDPTDLLALLVLPVVGRWAVRVPASENQNDWRLPLQMMAIGAAVVATTATSCDPGLQGRVAVEGDRAYADTHDGVFESTDGGRSWNDTGLESWEVSFEWLEAPGSANPASCIEADRCFEIDQPRPGVADQVVVEVRNGDRRELLTLTGTEQDGLVDLVPSPCDDWHLGGIAAVELDDGEHVIVSMGRAGALHYGPDQRWEWVALGDFGLTESQLAAAPFGVADGSTVGDDLVGRVVFRIATVVLFLAGPLVAVAVVPIRRLARRHGRDPGTAIGLCIGAAMPIGLIGLGLLFATGLGIEREPRIVAAGVVLVLAVAAVAPLLVWHARPRRALRPPTPGARVG